MTSPDVREVLGIVGGTGPQGRGLAARWARAGHTVHIGSRRQEKAEGAVADVTERIGEGHEVRRGPTTWWPRRPRSSSWRCRTRPSAPCSPLAEACAGKVVCNVVNPMVFDERGPRRCASRRGPRPRSVSNCCRTRRSCSAFHDVSSRRLLRTDEPIDTHVLICSDDEEAGHRVAHLATRIEGMWGVYCGPLRMSEYVENITPLILTINKYYRIQAGLQIDGIEHSPNSPHAHLADESGEAGRWGND